ncbi:hypothetical protein EV714DRAFT_201394 [Schizophyllum commune]
MCRVSVDELLERAASVTNLAMLREYAKPSPIQIAAINEYTPLLESKLSALSPSDAPTRERILAQLNIHRSILAPIRRLPIELLCDIFLLVLEEYPLRTLQAATIVSHVCVTWRNVAREHGALWTKAVVETLDDFDDYCERFLPMAKHVPLELRCDNHKIIWDLWDRMTPFASRWRRITLGACLSTLRGLKVLYMERLERLVIFAYDAPISPDFSVLDFVVAPRLRHIGLALDELQSTRQLHIPVTWALTSLEITAMSPFPVTNTLPLLRECSDTLRALTLKIRYPWEDDEGSYPMSTSDTFVMTALTLLSLVDPACALLNHITAPLLDELILSNVPTYGTKSLLGFLARSQASLRLHILRVYQVKEKEISAWIPCLRLMDNLSQLHFDELLSSEEFLRLLVRLEPPLLPFLEHVAIVHIFWNNPCLEDAIANLCEAREKQRVENGRKVYIPLGWIKE